MLAIELVSDPATREPDADFAQRVIAHARDLGLLLLKCGPHKNVVRLLPPLTASADEITSGVAMLEAAVCGAQA
jgi:4-aminobutyrate aminotransferase / (S)-3-amino-2-methylpropionate transaminase / 5-aminovalerate transaminase